jgi:hypothetical protein
MTGLFLQKNLRKKIAALMICSTVFLVVPKPVYAWDAVPAELLGQAIQKIVDVLDKMLQGIAKSLAVQLAVRQANKLTGDGHKNGPSFITDYKRYIYSIALDESLVYVNDFMTQTLGAKYSGLVYVAASGNLQSLGRNYMSYLAAEANAGLQESYSCKYTLDQYSNNPLTSLQKGDWRVFNALIANPCNNPTGYTNQVKRAFQEDLQRRTDLARTRAIAGQGFTGTERKGIITAPGALIKDVTAKAQGLAMDLIPNATGWSEIISASAGAFVNTVMTNLIQRGFESVAKKVDRELGKVDQKVLEARRDIEKELGPGAAFFRNNVQQIGNAATNSYKVGGSASGGQAKVNFPTVPSCIDGQVAC